MNIAEFSESKYLKKEDAGKGILVTIDSVARENVAMEGEPPDHKAVMKFEESCKPFVVNPTNLQMIPAVIGSDDTDDWRGHKIVLYNEPKVSYKGKLTGGIRARAPRGQAAVKAAMAAPMPALSDPVPEEPADDGTP